MGGLIFGGALMNGYCQMSNTSSWYASGMPANGSTVVNLLENYCYNASSAVRLILDKCMISHSSSFRDFLFLCIILLIFASSVMSK